MIRLYRFGPLLLVAACQQPQHVAPASPPPPSNAFAMAEAKCGQCHALVPNQLSPLSIAPPFSELVNTEGLTKETLSVWLSGAHNYPTEMDFQLNKQEVELIVTHMLALKDPQYKPTPD